MNRLAACAPQNRKSTRCVDSPFCFPNVALSCFMCPANENGSASLQAGRPEIERRGTTRTRRARQYFPGSCARDRGAHKEVHDLGVQISVVIGGGNIWRGLAAADRGMDRTTADYMGMLATVINALALRSTLAQMGVETRVQTAIEMKNVAEPFILGRAIRHLELGRVVIFAAGTGNPYFSTDTTAALRASEIRADVILKATKVDGIYDRDPAVDPAAVRFEKLTFSEALTKRLQVMDSTAFSLCMDNRIPIVVFDMNKPSNFTDVVLGKTVGTMVSE